MKIKCEYCPSKSNQKDPEQIAEQDGDWAMCKQCAIDEVNNVLGVMKLIMDANAK